jgi:hypothetical protein
LLVEFVEGGGEFGGFAWAWYFVGLVVFMLLEVGKFVGPLGFLF